MPAPRNAAAALMTVLLSACATPDLPPSLTLDDRTCVQQPDFSAARPITFARNGAITVEVNETAGCFLEEGARSAFVVFSLPEAAEEYVVSISSPPRGEALFAARALLYGGTGELMRELPMSAFDFRGNRLSLNLRVRAGERHLVVASDPAAIAQQVNQISDSVQQTMVGTGLIFVPVYTGTSATSTYTYSHNGSVTVGARLLSDLN